MLLLPTANALVVRRSATLSRTGSSSRFLRSVRAQTFIRKMRKGREKHATAAFFEIPDSTIQSILARAEANDDVPFDNEQWQLDRPKVEAGERTIRSSLRVSTS